MLLLTIILAQNDSQTKNYIVFGFYQVTFTRCKQPPCQVLLKIHLILILTL